MIIVWQVLKKLNVELPYSLAIPLPAIYPKELKAGLTHLSANAPSSIVHDGRKVETTHMSTTDMWINKM